MSKATAVQRSSGLELYRIIVMFLIIAHHYVCNSELVILLQTTMMTPNAIFLQIFVAWGKIGINCFVLITGYFMCSKSITARKFFQLLFQVLTYSVGLYVVFSLFGWIPFSWGEFLKAWIPFTRIYNNFTGCFLVFYLLIPFLGVLVRNLTEKQHLRLILLLLAVYTLFDSLPVAQVTMNYVTWFCILFVIAAYIRLHPKAIFENVRFWGYAAATSVTTVLLSVVLGAWAGDRFGYESLPYDLLTRCLIGDSNRILSVITGVCTFLFFRNWKLGYRKWINVMGGATFGILLFHSDGATMRPLWESLLHCGSMFDSPWLIPHALGSVTGIFLLGFLVDRVRAILIEKPVLALWDRWYPGLLTWFEKTESKICSRLNIKE